MPYLNLDDGFTDHPKIESLSDAEFRQTIRDICTWSKTGVATDFVRELIAERLVRRAPRHWLPDGIAPASRAHRRKIPDQVRFLVYERDGWACRRCGASADLTLDHVVPWSTGGPDDEANLQTLCRPCNSRKGARV